MYSRDFINKVREIYKKEKNLSKTAENFKLHKSTVSYIINNDYERAKKKTGPKQKITNRLKTKIKKEVRRLTNEN